MHIPPIPLPSASALPLKDAAPIRVLAAEQATEQAVLPVVSHTPALQVILGPIRAETPPPPVYEKPVVYQTYLRDQTSYQAGTASAQLANTLSSHLSSVRKNEVTFTPGLFFSQAGALSRETSSYANEARYTQVPANTAVEKFTPDFTPKGKVVAAATVNIRTRDGDTISLSLVQNNNGNGLSFSFTVEGHLSEAEQQALEKLAAKLGEVADEFFRSGTAELRGLEVFDTSVLNSFSLSLSQLHGMDQKTFTYDYAIDHANNTVHLSGKDVVGYTFDITAHMNHLLSGKTSATHQVLEQYLAVLRHAADDHDTPSSSLRFMLDGLRSVLLPARHAPVDTEPFARLTENFDSGLPDFSASFKSPVVHNPSNYSQVSFMSLNMGQTTRVENTDSRLLIQQESFYELYQNGFKALANLERPDFAGGNYVYVNNYARETITRTLATEGGQVKNIFIEHEREWQQSEQHLQHFAKVDQHESGDTDKTLIDLLDHTHLEQAHAKQTHAELMSILHASRQDLFHYW
jgi:hypothetical protein